MGLTSADHHPSTAGDAHPSASQSAGESSLPQQRTAGSRSTFPPARGEAGGQVEQNPHLFSCSHFGYSAYPVVTILSGYIEKKKKIR